MKPKEFEEGKHYYLEGNRVVFTALYLLERGFCCNNKCRHCPYESTDFQEEKENKKDFFYIEKDT